MTAAGLENALRIAGIGTWEWDITANTVAWSDEQYRIFGLAPRSLIIDYELYLTFVHPKDRPIVESIHARLLEGKDFSQEYRIVRRDGSVRTIHSQGTVIFDEGRASRVVGAVRDVTERREAEARFGEVFQYSPVAISITTRAEGRFIDVNESFLRIHEFRREEVLGKTSADLRIWPSRAERDAFVRSLEEDGGKNNFEMTRYTRSGRKIHVLASAVPIFFGGEPCFLVTGIDITESRQAQETIRWLAAIVESTDDAIVGETVDGTITSWNAGAARIFGFSTEEALGRSMRMLVPQEHQDEDQALRGAIREGKRVEPFDTSRRHKLGTVMPVNLTISPVRNAEGRIVGAATIARDITQRKALEDQLSQVQKMKAVGQLAGGIAHDFNNILTAINGYCELLLKMIPSEDRAHEMVREIRKSGERAAGLTRQLLAFSRKQILRPVSLDLNELISELEKMLYRLIGEDIELTTSLDPELDTVRADPSQLEQVIMNLVLNARDAMPRGGELRLVTRNVTLTDDLGTDLPPGRYVLLEVADTGCGMEQAVRERIFEPFFTTKEIGQGTGLGLASAYGIVKQSGGHIAVESKVGHGTTFKVYLPPAGEKAKTASDTGIFRIPAGGETILLAEDEPVVRQLARLTLESKGYTVLEAKDAAEALKLAESHQPIHLLLTDVVMPKMSGPQLATSVLSVQPNLKVLYMSGYAGEALVRHGGEEASSAFLPKPFTPAVLARKVREVLDARGEG